MMANESAVTRMRDAILARVRDARGDAGGERGVALLSAVIFMIIMAGISVVLLSVVLGQIVPSNIAQKNTKTIYAAQAGVQSALGVLRSASTTDATGHVTGKLSALPCTVSGRVDAQNNGTTYSATINYYSDDPTGPSPHVISCAAVQAGTQPNYARVDSTGSAVIPGSGATGSRVLSAVYQFHVSNVNIAGGRIFDGASTLCLEAVPLSSGAVSAGSIIKFAAASSCTSSTTNDAKQLWIYDKDYEIKLASTTVVGSTALCITGPALAGGATQDATLQVCNATTDAARWNQLWSWMGSYTWQGQNPDIVSGYSTYYLAGPIAAGNHLRVQAGGTTGTFNPMAAVGAGAASAQTKQIVNYLEFGRCLDVTGEQIASTFMISYPCKQDPSGTGNPPGTGKLLWNHKWYYNEPTAPATSLTQTISVKYLNDAAQTYCLQTPATGSGSIYPTFKTCNGNALQDWTRVFNTNTYLTSYWFKDSNGLCLSVGTNPADVYTSNGSSFSKIIVASCTGSLAQKWNSPAAYTSSTVSGYREVNP